jgi:transposase
LGWLQASFSPPKGQRDVRDLPPYRTKLVQERVREGNRVPGVLERANIQLAAVISASMGVAGRAMLEALIAGRAEPATMAALAQRRMRAQIPLLEPALTGVVHDQHRQPLAMPLAPIDFLDAQTAALNQAIEASLKTRRSDAPPDGEQMPLTAAHGTTPPVVSPQLPFPRAVELLETLPGIDPRGAAVSVAEIGMDMARFETAPRGVGRCGPRQR